MSMLVNSFAFGPPPIVYIPSHWNPGGRGDRTSSITITTTATLGGGTINNLIDGAYTSNTSDACWFSGGQSTREVKFDFGVAKIIDGFTWLQDLGATHGTWVFEGSNDDSLYATIGSSFTLGSSRQASIYTFSNPTAYRYYKLRQTAGTTSTAPWLREIEFSIYEPGVDTARDMFEKGNRSSLITVSTTATMASGTTIDNIVDGDYSQNATGSANFTNGESGKEIKFDFGSGVTKIVTGFLWQQHSDTGNGTWVFEGSNDDSSYTGLGSSLTLGASAIQAITFTNSTAYRYYRLRQTTGTTSSTPWLIEIEFRIA